VDAIAVTPFEVHAIDDALCTRCDACRRVCPVEAVELSTGREKSHAAH
jgi:NADH-quinone oxidoreductase subunit F